MKLQKGTFNEQPAHCGGDGNNLSALENLELMLKTLRYWNTKKFLALELNNSQWEKKKL